MEEIFDQLFLIIPVALIVFVRLFYENGKKKRIEAARLKGSGGVQPAHWRSPSVLSAISDAWRNQSLDRSSGTAAAGSSRAGHRSPTLHSIPLHRQNRALARGEDDDEGSGFKTGSQVRTGPKAAAFSSPFVSSAPSVLNGVVSVRPVPEKSVSGAFARIDALSPLRRAIVMSELLGKPVSLRDP